MINATGKALLFALALGAGILPGPANGKSFAKNASSADVWLVRENLANRFGAECHKLELLRRELRGIADVLADLRDFELFPAELTGLDKTNLIRFDKKVEAFEKRHAAIVERVETLRPQLLDAMSILREMVVRKPVESMFELLEQGDMQRIAAMLTLKHQIDTLWKGIDTVLTTMMVGIGIGEGNTLPPGETAEFLSIIKANLGQQSDKYYAKMNLVKDTLVGRATERHVREMYTVELHRIRRYIKDGNYSLSERKISEAEARYQKKVSTTDLIILAARVALLSENYDKALTAAARIPRQAPHEELRTLYLLQSYYGLRQYDSVWQQGSAFDLTSLSGARRNILVWIIMESGLALGKKESFVRLASLVERSAPYAIHVLHTLGRSYLANGDPATALSVFESAIKITPRTEQDKRAAKEIRLAIAQTTYELGRYEQALSLFFTLLNENAEFERSLQGILWCYLSLGQNDKAEATLRKLINQAPESRYAAEAFLILARRYLNKAQYEWKKVLYLTREEQRLKDLLDRIARKQAHDTALAKDKKIVDAQKELSNLLGRLRAEPRDEYRTIVSYYDDIARITGLITSYYQTGSFQQVAFTEKREALLHFLDSLIIATNASSGSGTARRSVPGHQAEVIAVKNIVAKADAFYTEAMIERFRFEQEHLNWQKEQLNIYAQNTLRPLESAQDSTSRSAAYIQKKRFERILDSLLLVEDATKKTWQARLMSLLTKQLETITDSATAAYFHYHLGELHYASENARYAAAFEQYEKIRADYEQKMERFRDGTLLELPVEPEPPRIDHGASIREFRAALRFKGHPETAGSAHYSMAWCFNDQGIFDSALAHMDSVSSRYPQSPYAAQAWMYIGEYLFEKGNLSKAIQCYQSVMKYPESEWFDEALYKLAWSQYRLSNPEKAISSFLALVDLGAGRGGKSLLEKESMDYIAISFSEADMTGEKGLERAVAFAKKLGDSDRGSQILHRLARVYKDQGRYDLSKKTYRTLLRMNPAYRNMPGVENEFLAILERDASPEDANMLKIDFWKKYHRKGTWAKTQTDPEAVAMADSLAEKQLYEATIGFHQLALQKNDAAAYARALDVYTDFIRSYPASPRASECHYNLAEIEFSLGNYLKAAEEYIAVSRRYPDSKLRETAAWNAIVASQNLLKKEGTPR